MPRTISSVVFVVKNWLRGVLEHASHHRTKLVNRHFQGVLSIQQIAAGKFTR